MLRQNMKYVLCMVMLQHVWLTSAQTSGPLFTRGIDARNLVENDEYLGYITEEYVESGESLENVLAAACERATSEVHQRRLDAGEHMFTSTRIAQNTFFAFTCPTDHVLVNLPRGIIAEKNGLKFTTAAPKSWGLDRIDQPSLPLSQTPLNEAFSGKGVTVYVVDTGINKDHEDFAGRASFGADFINEAELADMNGHGTHCAGTATGKSYGIARDAKVIGVKVLSAEGSGTNTGVVNGIQWAVEHAGKTPSVITMSLGGESSATVDAAVKSASAAGHIVTVAAGNENSDACSTSPAGAGGNALSGGVISVMASQSDDSLASYSNWGTCTDIIAPGTKITSAWIGSTTASKTISGTSMATPHVAGVAAVLLEKHRFDKQKAQQELLELRVLNQISGDTHNGPNALLQVPRIVDTPAPTIAPRPTVRPTQAPTQDTKLAQLCAGMTCTTILSLSTFGGEWPESGAILAGGVVAGTDLCEPVARYSFTGKFVLVKRGSCSFYTKVSVAEAAGAIGVIIQNYENARLITPSYFGNDILEIPSLMIQYDIAEEMKHVWNTDKVGYGRFNPGDYTRAPTPAPTLRGTEAPTVAPTSWWRPLTPKQQREWMFCSSLNEFDCKDTICRCGWNAAIVDQEEVAVNDHFEKRQCLPNFLFGQIQVI